jgi:hypothetical protein
VPDRVGQFLGLGLLIVRVIFVVLAVIVCPLLWTAIIVPLLARFTGIPIKIGALPIEKRNPRMSDRQSFWFAGVLGWGVGVFSLGTLMARFVDGRRPTILEDLFGFVLVVVFWALLNQGGWTYPIDEVVTEQRRNGGTEMGGQTGRTQPMGG